MSPHHHDCPLHECDQPPAAQNLQHPEHRHHHSHRHPTSHHLPTNHYPRRCEPPQHRLGNHDHQTVTTHNPNPLHSRNLQHSPSINYPHQTHFHRQTYPPTTLQLPHPP